MATMEKQFSVNPNSDGDLIVRYETNDWIGFKPGTLSAWYKGEPLPTAIGKDEIEDGINVKLEDGNHLRIWMNLRKFWIDEMYVTRNGEELDGSNTDNSHINNAKLAAFIVGGMTFFAGLFGVFPIIVGVIAGLFIILLGVGINNRRTVGFVALVILTLYLVADGIFTGMVLVDSDIASVPSFLMVRGAITYYVIRAFPAMWRSLQAE